MYILHLLIRQHIGLLLLCAHKYLLRMYINRFPILLIYNNVIYERLLNYVLYTVIYDYSKRFLYLQIIIIWSDFDLL